MRALLLAAAAFTLAACGQSTPVTPEPETPASVDAAPTTREGATAQDTCGASGYRGTIGTNVAAVTLPAGLNHRIIAPDTLVTMDFLAERVNFLTDANGLITAVECY